MQTTNGHRSTVEYLDALRAKIGQPGRPASDYAAARALKVSRQCVSKYRNRRGGFDDVVAIRAAELLGEAPEKVLLDIQIERDAPPEVRQLWEKIAARISAPLLVALLAAGPVLRGGACILC